MLKVVVYNKIGGDIMQTLEDAIRKKHAIIYLDTKLTFMDEVDQYNEQMRAGREKKERLKAIGKTYCAVSPILAVVLGIQKAPVILTAPFSLNMSTHLFIIVCALNIAAYFYLAIYRENYIVAAAFSVTLGFVHNPFFVVAVFNGVMAVIYHWYKKRVMKLRGYPVFQDIRITHRTVKEPDDAEIKSADEILRQRNNY